jgi:hypothetical protein
MFSEREVSELLSYTPPKKYLLAIDKKFVKDRPQTLE